jgi:hypothetical protein
MSPELAPVGRSKLWDSTHLFSEGEEKDNHDGEQAIFSLLSYYLLP